jgi:hypothetical protein
MLAQGCQIADVDLAVLVVVTDRAFHPLQDKT